MSRIAVSVILTLALSMAIPSATLAQFDAERDIGISAVIAPAPVPGGGSALQVTFDLPPNTHITSLENGFFFVTPDSLDGIAWNSAQFPPGVVAEGETVYRGKVTVAVPFSLAASFGVGSPLVVEGTAGYQACTEVDPIFCSPPMERRFRAETVVSAGSAGSGAAAPPLTEGMSIEERAKRALEEGSLMALLWVFIGGVLLSFTPCVYPVIPITIAYIGGHAGGSRLKGLSLSLAFVLGLGLVYSTLGVVAAATGGVFGLSTQNPWVIGFVTVVFLIMGNGMLGAFDIQLPSSVQTALVSKKRSGYLGALFVGGTTGLVAAPCVGPVLVALLSWVASTGKIFAGFIYLFVFALGLGALFILIGTFAGALAALPTAGGWMDRVKHFFGVVMIAVAYYMARPLIPTEWFLLSVGFGLIALAAFFGGFHRIEKDAEFVDRWLKAATTFMIVAGIFYTLLGLARLNGVIGGGTKDSGALVVAEKGPEGSEAAGVKWIHDDEARAFAEAKSSGKPLMIDFWAEWCVACKELDHITFSDPTVAKLIVDRFVPLKIDGTKANGPVKEIWSRYKVVGLPTIIFLAPDGRELDRFEAFRTVEQTLPVMRRAAGI